MSGPLQGCRIVEIAGIGPTQFCGMLLADMGASVIRIDRPGSSDVGVGLPPQFNLMNRSRPTIEIDLKTAAGVRLVLQLCRKADALFEGFRPGTMEKLGLGPAACSAVNERLVYGRMTGWGQSGPLAHAAGHDGNYAALSGALAAIGPAGGPPVVPLNLVADFGGGGVFLALGLLAALLEARRSGRGQVVDAAMVDGAASLMTLFYGLRAGGLWQDRRGSNFLDGAAPFYRPYRTRDGKYVIVCAIEAKFFVELLRFLDVEEIDPADQFDVASWPAQVAALDAAFAARTRQEWCDLLQGTDACFAPVLTLEEAPDHPHNVARNTFVDVAGIRQPAPAPRFSRTASHVRAPAAAPAAEPRAVLLSWGLSASELDEGPG